MPARKIDAMHQFYGKDPEERKCAECEFLLHGRYHDKWYYKCEVYGCSHSESTDWRKSYGACGLIGKAFPEGDTRIKDVVSRERPKEEEPMPGQLSMF